MRWLAVTSRGDWARLLTAPGRVLLPLHNLQKIRHFRYIDTVVGFHAQEILVTRDDVLRTSAHRAFENSIVVRVFLDDIQFDLRSDEAGRVHCDLPCFDNFIRCRAEFAYKDISEFIQDCGGDDQVHLPCRSEADKLGRIPSPEDNARNQKIGIGSSLQHLTAVFAPHLLDELGNVLLLDAKAAGSRLHLLRKTVEPA